MATVHELRAPLTVLGDEHYLVPMKKFSCYGYPVIHPLTHRLEGVLDLTFFVDEGNPLLHPMVEHAARDIEAQLLQQSPRDEQTLIEKYQRVSVRRRGAPLVGDRRRPRPGELSRHRATGLGGLRGARNDHRGDVGGVAHPEFRRPGRPAPDARDARRRHRLRDRPASGRRSVGDVTAPPVRSRSRAERVETQIADARAHRRSLSVVGERGTGRSTALTRLMADADPVVFDGLDRVHEPESAWLQRLVDALERCANVR